MMTYSINIFHAEPRGHLGTVINEQVNKDLIFEDRELAVRVASQMNLNYASGNRRFVVCELRQDHSDRSMAA